MSYADGHADLHKWITSILKIPVAYGYLSASITAGIGNQDWRWWSQHTSYLLP